MMMTTEEEPEDPLLTNLFDEDVTTVLPAAPPEPKKSPLSEKARKVLRKVFALYNCSRRPEFLKMLRNFTFDFYKLAESNKEFYQEETLLVQMLKDLVVGESQLEE